VSGSALPRAANKPGVPPLMVAVLVSFGSLFEVANTTGIAIGLRTIAGDLGSAPEEADTILTAYLVAQAAILPLSGWAAVYFGRKRFYITCVALFTFASFLCSIAWSMESLIIFRILQGAAAAGNAASESSLIADSLPPEKRGLGFAIYGMAVVVGPTFGPIYGGWVTENYSWNWIFLLNVPVGIAAVSACMLLLQDPTAVREETRKRRAKGLRLDWFGFVLAAGGLALVSYVLDKGQTEDWFGSSTILWATLAGCLMLALLPLWSLLARDPVLDFRLFNNRNPAIAAGLLFVTGTILFGAPTIFPLLLQQEFGYTATLAGMVNGLGGLSVFVLLIFVGPLTGKVATRTLVGSGFVAVAFGMYLSSTIYPDMAFWQVTLVSMAQSIGIAVIFSPLQSHSFIGVPGHLREQVGAFNAMAVNLGGSVGTAVGITLLERGRQSFREELVPYASPYRDEYRQALEQYGSLGAFDQVVNSQASVLSFQAVFFTLAVIALCCLPLLLFLKGKPGPEDQG